MKKRINEYEISKTIIGRLREEIEKSKDIVELMESEIKEEQELFTQNVTDLVRFNEIKVYKSSMNVEWSGVLLREDIEWEFSLDDSQGVYVKVKYLQLTDSAMNTLNKLVKYYSVWSDKWASEKLPEMV